MLLAGAIGLALATSGCLAYLLWSYLPRNAALLDGLGVEIPRSTGFAFLLSNWLVRLFPLLVLLFVAAGVLVALLFAIAAVRLPLAHVLKAAAALALVVALGEAATCAFIVYAVRAAYATMGARPEDAPRH